MLRCGCLKGMACEMLTSPTTTCDTPITTTTTTTYDTATTTTTTTTCDTAATTTEQRCTARVGRLSPLAMELDLVGVDASIANALRRIMYAEVPTMAAELVYFYFNDSIVSDEGMALRIGLVPIKADPRLFQEKGAFRIVPFVRSFVHSMSVSVYPCAYPYLYPPPPHTHTLLAHRGAAPSDPCTDLNTLVFELSNEHARPTSKGDSIRLRSGHLRWMPQGNQLDRLASASSSTSPSSAPSAGSASASTSHGKSAATATTTTATTEKGLAKVRHAFADFWRGQQQGALQRRLKQQPHHQQHQPHSATPSSSSSSSSSSKRTAAAAAASSASSTTSKAAASSSKEDPSAAAAHHPFEQQQLMVRPVVDDIVISKHNPRDIVRLRLHAFKGVGREHAKWCPVELANYRLLPQITLLQPIRGEAARRFQSCFEPGVIQLVDEDEDGDDDPKHKPKTKHHSKKHHNDDHLDRKVARVANARNHGMSRECFRHPEFQDKVLLSRVRDHFICTSVVLLVVCESWRSSLSLPLSLTPCVCFFCISICVCPHPHPTRPTPSDHPPTHPSSQRPVDRAVRFARGNLCGSLQDPHSQVSPAQGGRRSTPGGNRCKGRPVKINHRQRAVACGSVR